MIIESESMLKVALDLIVNHSDKIQLMNNIFETVEDVDLKDITDEHVRNVLKAVQDMSKAVVTMGVRSKEQVKNYFEQLNLDEDVKSIVTIGNVYEDKFLEDYSLLFARAKYQPEISRLQRKLTEATENFLMSGAPDIKDNISELIEAENKLGQKVAELANDSTDRDIVLISSNDETKEKGLAKLEESFDSVASRIKTGMFMDHVTGGGFRGGCSYIVASISGGFKSGFMQNMAEYMSLANDPKYLNVPTGSKAFILYVNLEMSQTQMTERRAAFYGIDKNDLYNKEKGTAAEQIREKLKETDAKIDVIYQKEKPRTYSAQNLLNDIQYHERFGMKCIAVVFDYSDLLKYTMEKTDELERISPLVRKNEGLRDIAQKLNIPVLTGIQLNRSSSETKKMLDQSDRVDILKNMASDSIAKSFDVINVPEQLYFCMKFPAGDQGEEFFSIIVDKDRDNNAKYIDKDGKEQRLIYNRVHYVAKMDGMKITNIYKDSISAFNINLDDSVVTSLGFSPDDI